MSGFPGYDDVHAWCAWRNSELANGTTGNMWVVGTDGRPFITDDPSVTAARHKREKIAAEAERKRYNHRQMHPVTEQAEAAE